MNSTSSVATRAALAVGLMIGFYVLAVAIAGVLLYLPYAELVYAHQVHPKLALIGIVGAGTILWSILPRWDPTADEVFYGGDVSVSVQMELDRDLRPGDSLVVFLDGQRVPDVSGLSTTLTGLTRGTHFLRAAVTDEAGSVVITSPQVTFHMRQQSVAQPPTGPNLRPPPPKPTQKPATPK